MRTAKPVISAAVMAFMIIAPSVFAQSMYNADMSARANMRINDKGDVQSCGFEVNGVHVVAPDGVTVFSTSLMVLEDGYALGKLTGKKGKLSDGVEGLTDVEVHGGWFRTPGQPAAAPIQPLIDGESHGSKLFPADFRPALETLAAIATGLELQISISWHPGRQSIYFGHPKLDPSQQEQFFSCIKDMERSIERQLIE